MSESLFRYLYLLASGLIFTVLFIPASFMPGAIAQGGQQSLVQARQLLIDGTNLLHLNKNQEAKDKLTRACTLAPDLPQAHHQLGIALAKLGQNEDAGDEFSTAIKLDPNMAASWLNLASVYQSSGKLDQAKFTYEQFIRLFPHDQDISKIRTLVALLDKAIAEKGRSGVTPAINNNAQDYYEILKAQGVWRWPRNRLPLTIYIEPVNVANGALPQYISILKAAFMDWVRASNGLLTLNFVDNINQALVTCTWSADPNKFQESNEAAITRLYADQYGLNRGELAILTISPNTGKAISDNQARSTSLHEAGHILGLMAHSDNPDDIMYLSESLKDTWAELSNRDKNTLVRLYR